MVFLFYFILLFILKINYIMQIWLFSDIYSIYLFIYLFIVFAWKMFLFILFIYFLKTSY